MVNWLVAVDSSEYSQWAFNVAISLLNPQNDTLFVLAVALEEEYLLAKHHWHLLSLYRDAQLNTARIILKSFHGQAKLHHVANVVLLMGWATHIGEAICATIEEKKIDYLVVGRRSIGKIKRFIVGSTSKFVVENANCAVIIAKNAVGPLEGYAKLQELIKQEEERQKKNKRK